MSQESTQVGNTGGRSQTWGWGLHGLLPKWPQVSTGLGGIKPAAVNVIWSDGCEGHVP